jgi:NitT/TauT family transport system ATP-binding protein
VLSACCRPRRLCPGVSGKVAKGLPTIRIYVRKSYRYRKNSYKLARSSQRSSSRLGFGGRIAAEVRASSDRTNLPKRCSIQVPVGGKEATAVFIEGQFKSLRLEAIGVLSGSEFPESQSRSGVLGPATRSETPSRSETLAEPELSEGGHLGTAIRLDRVSKVYGRGPAAVQALDRVSLEVGFGEFVCIVGASGCGKSTLLSLIAGLESPTAGTIEVRVRTALMFQDPALFPWLTVRQNVELPLKLQRIRREHRADIVKALLEMVHLKGFENHRPHELSGGMRQRAALARALAQHGEGLLMDEPFAALDAITRDALHEEIEQLWQETGFTVVFVTHNVREAVRLGDRVVVMSSRPGRIVEDIKVDLDRPRKIESPEVATLAAKIMEVLHAQVRLHGAGRSSLSTKE